MKVIFSIQHQGVTEPSEHRVETEMDVIPNAGDFVNLPLIGSDDGLNTVVRRVGWFIDEVQYVYIVVTPQERP